MPQYPPYIPEQDMNLTSGMPRSTLDGIHDDGGVIIKKPGELGPPAYPDAPPYTESPPDSGVWVPDNRPAAPGSTFPMSSSGAGDDVTGPASWSGKGSDAAADAETSLRQKRAAIDEAEQALYRNLNDAHTGDAAARAQLQRIHQEVTAGVASLQPSMSTPAGRQQMADFLEAKAHQAREVVADAQRTADRITSALSPVGHQYSSTF